MKTTAKTSVALTVVFALSITHSIGQYTWHDVGGGCYHPSNPFGWSNPYVLETDTVNNILYLAGDIAYFNNGNVYARGAAQWDGSTFSPLGCPNGEDYSNWLPCLNQVGVCHQGNFLLANGGNGTAADSFCLAWPSIPRSFVGRCKYNGASFDSLGWGKTVGWYGLQHFNDMCIYKDKVIITGNWSFGISTPNGSTPTLGGIAILDSTGIWGGINVNGNLGISHPSNSGFVYGAIEYNGELFINGGFSHAGGIALTSYGSARYNGQTWLSCGTTGSGFGKFGIYNNELYMGQFTGLGIYKWTGSDWILFATGQPDSGGYASIEEIIEFDGKMVVTGAFSSINGVAANYIAMWDGVQWLPMENGLNGQGFALAVYKGSLYVGGSFFMAGSTPVHNIARWGPATVIDEALTTPEFTLSPNPATNQITLTLKDGGAKKTVYVYDITGKLQMEERFNSSGVEELKSSGVHQLDISMLTSGIYIVEVQDAKGNAARKKLVNNDFSLTGRAFLHSCQMKTKKEARF